MPQEANVVEEAPSVSALEEYRILVRKEEREAAEKHYKELHLVWQAKDLAELETKMDVQVQEGIQKLFDKWKEEQKPPTKEQIAELVKQEYVDFEVKIRGVEPGSEEEKEITFTIRELPQAVEITFYKIFKKGLIENLPQLNAFQQKNMDKNFDEKVKGMLEAIEGGMDLLAEMVSLVLDPRKKKGYTADWVRENIGSQRQWNIVQAQLEANKLRDFFSSVSQSGQVIQTMTQPLNYQALLQRLP